MVCNTEARTRIAGPNKGQRPPLHHRYRTGAHTYKPSRVGKPCRRHQGSTGNRKKFCFHISHR